MRVCQNYRHILLDFLTYLAKKNFNGVIYLHGKITDAGDSAEGEQFVFSQPISDAGVAISMDGKGRWVDNVMIERIWRSVKWECLYLREVITGSQARKILRD
jgi:transposase InsO family protein